MNADDYVALAMRTAKDMGTHKLNLIHAAMGMSSDAGEFVDCVKKYAIYGKALDVDNALEEIGDVLWFCALACRTIGASMSAVMAENINKLAKRYPEKYTDEAAIARADKQVANGLNAVDAMYNAIASPELKAGDTLPDGYEVN